MDPPVLHMRKIKKHDAKSGKQQDQMMQFSQWRNEQQ
jgi:hypothetical protein